MPKGREPMATSVHPPGINCVEALDLPFNKIPPVQLPLVLPSVLFSSVSTQESHVPVSTTASSEVARSLMVNDISSIMQDNCPSFKDSDRIHNLPSLLPILAEIKSLTPLKNSLLRPVLINCIRCSHQVRHYYSVVSIVLGKWESPRPVHDIGPIKLEVLLYTNDSEKGIYNTGNSCTYNSYIAIARNCS